MNKCAYGYRFSTLLFELFHHTNFRFKSYVDKRKKSSYETHKYQAVDASIYHKTGMYSARLDFNGFAVGMCGGTD